MSAQKQSQPEAKPEPTKKIKARVINEETGDLEFALVDVPMSDLRPAFDPKTMSLKDKNDTLGRGKEPT